MRSTCTNCNFVINIFYALPVVTLVLICHSDCRAIQESKGRIDSPLVDTLQHEIRPEGNGVRSKLCGAGADSRIPGKNILIGSLAAFFLGMRINSEIHLEKLWAVPSASIF